MINERRCAHCDLTFCPCPDWLWEGTNPFRAEQPAAYAEISEAIVSPSRKYAANSRNLAVVPIRKDGRCLADQPHSEARR